MYVLIAGDHDPDYSRAYGPFDTAGEAFARVPEDSDDTRWRVIEIQSVTAIHTDPDYGDEDEVGLTVAAAVKATVEPLMAEEQMLELIQRYGGNLFTIPAPNPVVHQWAESRLRALGERTETLDEADERQLRTWRGLLDTHKPVVAQAAPVVPAPTKRTRKPSPAQLAKQALKARDRRVDTLTQLYRGVEGIPAPNADVYTWVQDKLADMGEGGHPVAQGIADYYFGKAPHTITGRARRQAEEALATNRAWYYPLRDKHAPKG